MTSSPASDKPVGVIGAGNFGTVIANILAINRKVILYARDEKMVAVMRSKRESRGHALHPQVEPTHDLASMAAQCDVIFPMVPSLHFRAMMKQLSPHLHPYHILIHGTKGFDITLPKGQTIEGIAKLTREHVKTMSEVIQEESVVVRVGCLAGPNLSKELAQRQPGATVVASHFNEVRQLGKKLLRNDRFQVYENNDIVGVDISGV